MNRLLLIALSATLLFLSACGLSEKEKATLLQTQQAKDDSIRVGQIDALKAAQAEKAALNDSLTYYTTLLNDQQRILVQIRTNIFMANEDMKQVQAFHFGRLPADKEAQIRAQELKVQNLTMQQSNLLMSMQHSEKQVTAFKGQLAAAR